MLHQNGTGRVAYNVSGTTGSTTLTLTNSNTYNNADGSDVGTPISQTFLAGDTVSNGAGATGTLTADADDAGPTITLFGVTGTWAAGMEVVSDTEITEFAPDADDLEFTSSVPSGTNITTYAFATWEVDTDSLFGSPMTATKAITAGLIQELLPSERGAITLADDTEYHVRVKYDSADPSGVESQYSDVNQFKTAAARTAQDGWFLSNTVADKSWKNLAYGNGKYVALSYGATQTDGAMYSNDGISWTAVDLPAGMQYVNGVAYGDNKFVAVCELGSPRIAYSDDGIVWKTTGISGFDNTKPWFQIEYVNGKFIAFDNSGASIAMVYSTDGLNWSAGNINLGGSGANVTVTGISYGNNVYVGYGSPTAVLKSSDGINWSLASDAQAGTANAVHDGTKFVGVGAMGFVNHSSDGDVWTAHSMGAGPSPTRRLAFGNNIILAVGNNSTNSIAYSEDGFTWNGVAAPSTQTWVGVIYAGGKFIAGAQSGTNLMYSESGKGDPAFFRAYDADNNKPVNDLNIVDRYGVDPTADNTHLGIYELTEQPTDAVAAYVPEGDKYKPIIDLSQPLEQAQAEAAQANARLDEANATIETMRSNFEERISALENPNTKTASTKTAKKN